MTDPRFTDPRLSDPVVRRDESAAGGMWGWIAGVAVLLLIGFLIIAGWNNNTNTASSGSSTTTSSSTAPRMTPPADNGLRVVVNAAALAAGSVGSVGAV